MINLGADSMGRLPHHQKLEGQCSQVPPAGHSQNVHKNYECVIMQVSKVEVISAWKCIL